MKIGCHVRMFAPNYLLDSVKEALSYGANTFMFYTGAPQNSLRTPVEKLKIDEFKKILNDNHLNIKDIVVHAPYLINLGNCEDLEKFNTSIKMLDNELSRTDKIGCQYLVLHPGNALKSSKSDAILNIAKGINEVLYKYPNVTLLIETMAGKGSEVGSNFSEIKEIINKINSKNNIGVCLDTCHINDSGYDLNHPNEIINEFDKIIGLNYLKVIHVNDSKNILNSHKDRHANFGFGEIGFDNLINFIYHPLLEDKIFILETPWISFNGKKDIFPPYKFEIEMIKNKIFNPNLFNDVYNYYKIVNK